MKSLSKHLTESFRINESVKNFFESDKSEKNKYKDQVWKILQDAYYSQGGIKGSGFNSPDDMLNVPFWKLDVVNDEVLAVVMYKFKDAITTNNKVRKIVAMGTKLDKDRKNEISKKLHNIFKKEFERSILEVSGLAESYLRKNWPDLYTKYLIPFEKAEKILYDDELRKIDTYRYERKIGGQWHEKVLLGELKNQY